MLRSSFGKAEVLRWTGVEMARLWRASGSAQGIDHRVVFQMPDALPIPAPIQSGYLFVGLEIFLRHMYNARRTAWAARIVNSSALVALHIRSSTLKAVTDVSSASGEPEIAISRFDYISISHSIMSNIPSVPHS